jgi:hypothetical protein
MKLLAGRLLPEIFGFLTQTTKNGSRHTACLIA